MAVLHVLLPSSTPIRSHTQAVPARLTAEIKRHAMQEGHVSHPLLPRVLQQLRELAPLGLRVGLLAVGRQLEPGRLRVRALAPRARRMRLQELCLG